MYEKVIPYIQQFLAHYNDFYAENSLVKKYTYIVLKRYFKGKYSAKRHSKCRTKADLQC